MGNDDSSFAYHEPDIVSVLVLTAFLLLLNISNFILDKLVFCGLLGQILIGIWFGTPGAKWLSTEVEAAVQLLGYLGLILIVYEGGLNTSVRTLKANLLLSSVVALTGISAPIALSFVLRDLLSVTPLQAFAAGAALCSTSLGTTFTVLTTSGLTESRLGVILTSAAMMDDVVGLVMVKVISGLGTTNNSFGPITIIRPVLVSVAFAVVVPLMCARIIAPTVRRVSRQRDVPKFIWVRERIACEQCRFVLQSLFLIGLVTGATCSGTSGLFAAYIAGASITWFDDLMISMQSSSQSTCRPDATQREGNANVEVIVCSGATASICQDSDTAPGILTLPAEQASQTAASSGLEIYEKYYKPSVDAVIKPFFFASIGFSIPIARMLSGSIVWRGLVYAALMMFGKLLCGVWLIPAPSLRSAVTSIINIASPKKFTRCLPPACKPDSKSSKELNPTALVVQSAIELSGIAQPTPGASTQAIKMEPTEPPHIAESKNSTRASQPLSVYPSAVLGGAMIARGEIGFLISSVAKGSGFFSEELFLVVTWAIFLCTFAGPLLVGSLVKRMKALQNEERKKCAGRKDPLGIWGMSSIVS